MAVRRVVRAVKTVAACAALAVATSVIVFPAATAGTAARTCHGRPATVVGTPGHDLVGTEAADVVVSHGAPFVSTLGGDDLVCVTGATYFVYSGSGDDTVDATTRAGEGLTDLGLGADTFTGGPGYDRVHTGETHREGPDVDLDRDVVVTGVGGSRVFSGTNGSVNNDDLMLSDTPRRRNTLFFEGVQGALGQVSFGTGKAELAVLGVDGVGDVTTVDNHRRTVLVNGSPVLDWNGEVDRFYVASYESEALVFLGTEAAEHLVVSQWMAVQADMGPGDDKVTVGCTSPGNPEPSRVLCRSHTGCGSRLRAA